MRRYAVHLVAGLLLASSSMAQAATETILHRFAGGAQDGKTPEGKLAIDSAGAIYGSTHGGGLRDCHTIDLGCGVIFKLTRAAKPGPWTEKFIFKYTADAYSPTTGVLVDRSGNIYATAQTASDGVVFSLVRTAFPSFPYQFESLLPDVRASSFTFGPRGLYGVGTGRSGTGAVFVVPLLSGQSSVSYNMFQDAGDGPPVGNLAVTDDDKIFGTTATGGKSGGGTTLGTAFELAAPTSMSSPARVKSTLYSFLGGAAGSTPVTGLISDAAGNLYGATAHGGAGGTGVVFKLSPPKASAKTWTETVLHAFGSNGYPQGDMILVKGVLYGTTGGDVARKALGEVFSLKQPASGQGSWTYTVLHKFTGGQDGALPRGGLVADAKGALYGTTTFGGGLGNCSNSAAKGCGTVFKIIP